MTLKSEGGVPSMLQQKSALLLPLSDSYLQGLLHFVAFLAGITRFMPNKGEVSLEEADQELAHHYLLTKRYVTEYQNCLTVPAGKWW